MNTLLGFDQTACTVSIVPDAELTELSFAVECAASNFLGRGVNRFECTRTKNPAGGCVLTFKALKKSGPILLSKVGPTALATEERLFPRNLLASEKFQLEEGGFQKVAADGQHRHGRMTALTERKLIGDETISIVESYDLNPNLPLTVLTYSIADLFTGLFSLGVTYVKWQGSLKQTQLYIKHRLTDKQLGDFILSTKDYDINRKVGTLL